MSVARAKCHAATHDAEGALTKTNPRSHVRPNPPAARGRATLARSGAHMCPRTARDGGRRGGDQAWPRGAWAAASGDGRSHSAHVRSPPSHRVPPLAWVRAPQRSARGLRRGVRRQNLELDLNHNSYRAAFRIVLFHLFRPFYTSSCRKQSRSGLCQAIATSSIGCAL